jgi:hypothetical protein
MRAGTREIIIAVGIVLPLLALWIVVAWDLVRRQDLPAPRKALWGAAIFLFAYFGIAAYAIARPAPEPHGKTHRTVVAEASRKVDELERLVAAQATDPLPNHDYLARKRAILGLEPAYRESDV